MCDICKAHGLKPSTGEIFKNVPHWFVGLSAAWGLLGMVFALGGPAGWAVAALIAAGGQIAVQRTLSASRKRKVEVVLLALHPNYCRNGLRFLADHDPARLNALYEAVVKKAFDDAREDEAPRGHSKQEVRQQQEQHVRSLEVLLARHVRRRGARAADVAKELETERRILSHFDSGDQT